MHNVHTLKVRLERNYCQKQADFFFFRKNPFQSREASLNLTSVLGTIHL